MTRYYLKKSRYDFWVHVTYKPLYSNSNNNINFTFFFTPFTVKYLSFLALGKFIFKNKHMLKNNIHSNFFFLNIAWFVNILVAICSRNCYNSNGLWQFWTHVQKKYFCTCVQKWWRVENEDKGNANLNAVQDTRMFRAISSKLVCPDLIWINIIGFKK